MTQSLEARIEELETLAQSQFKMLSAVADAAGVNTLGQFSAPMVIGAIRAKERAALAEAIQKKWGSSKSFGSFSMLADNIAIAILEGRV